MNSDAGQDSTYQQAKATNEVIKVQKNKEQLKILKDQNIDREKSFAHVTKLALAGRNTWPSWVESVSTELAEEFELNQQTLHSLLMSGVKQHLDEMGDLILRLN